ncbi:hypothetical protein [Pseudomonas sp. 2995-1]|uniref:hypothetical protein n=1 Tax=Pseudomonas sp. 2995-1 TaxID=1712679 RepID=UPI000C15286B|nr:hypothetical protein [Pseudomonas sp. 2995-1]PIB56170.1 hypothetical protein AOA61_11585 [Pseudomonas sp. 2995-1]
MWQSKLKLNDGETLKHVSSRSKGSMAQEDITEWSVLNSSGEVVGTVIHNDHTALNGFRRTQSVRQTDSQNNVLVDESWTG